MLLKLTEGMRSEAKEWGKKKKSKWILTPIGVPAAIQTKVQSNKDMFQYGRCWCQIPPQANRSRRKREKNAPFRWSSDMQGQGELLMVQSYCQCHYTVRCSFPIPLVSEKLLAKFVFLIWKGFFFWFCLLSTFYKMHNKSRLLKRRKATMKQARVTSAAS